MTNKINVTPYMLKALLPEEFPCKHLPDSLAHLSPLCSTGIRCRYLLT